MSSSRKAILGGGTIVLLGIVYYFSLPVILFNRSFSTVLEDRNGRLLSANIAADGQWRFPESKKVPGKFSTAIIAFEDNRFRSHPGIDVLALARAVRENLKAGKIVNGGSTLTMQVIRLSKDNPPRTFFQKFKELILATRLECRHSKDEILSLYASHAPFGGNVVGLEAACWRYFGRPADELSWAEAALLAVLPNNPSLIHLARNRSALQLKRDRLLERLFKQGHLGELDYSLAIAEKIPGQPQTLPKLASHLLTRIIHEGRGGQKVRSTIDGALQENVENTLGDYGRRLRGSQIHNAAALILDVSSGDVLAYAGNIASGDEHGEQVDIIRSPRSTGSILKPFLFAAMLDDGKILQRTLIPDVPLLINGFAPRNFSRQFEGVVPADKALTRSLNVPAVVELRDYKYEKFYHLLQGLGMTTLHQDPDHYGLTLVLGGAEGTLWDITGMYASAARTLKNYFAFPGSQRYHRGDFHQPQWEQSSSEMNPGNPELSSWLSAGSISITFETLRELYRPGEETGWQHFSSSKPVAWKTGTSFGFRDGWAVGVNPDYAVGVWVGNADGEGRPGLTGTEAAAPLLFNLFSLLPGKSWFEAPESEFTDIVVCRKSGYRASTWCDAKDTIRSLKSGIASALCDFHQLVHLTPDKKFRVHADCYPTDKMIRMGWFVLPPLSEYYYRARNLSYTSLPPYKAGCANPSVRGGMDLIYPGQSARLFVPHQLDGQAGAVVLEAVHRQPSARVFWHLDGQYAGVTQGVHHLIVSPAAGSHMLTLVDDSGEILQRNFEVLSNR